MGKGWGIFFFFFESEGKKRYQNTDLSYEAFFLKTKSINLEKYITFLIYYSLYTQKIMFLVYKSVRVFFLKVFISIIKKKSKKNMKNMFPQYR